MLRFSCQSRNANRKDTVRRRRRGTIFGKIQRKDQSLSPPLVLRGGFAAKRVRENLLRKFAPVYGIHYENVIVENAIENVAFENLKNLEKSHRRKSKP